MSKPNDMSNGYFAVVLLIGGISMYFNIRGCNSDRQNKAYKKVSESRDVDRFQQTVSEQLGRNNRNNTYIQSCKLDYSRYPQQEPTLIITIAGDSHPEDLTKTEEHLWASVKHLLRLLQKWPTEYASINITVTCPVRDQYGRDNEQTVLNAMWHKNDIDQMIVDNLDANGLLGLAYYYNAGGRIKGFPPLLKPSPAAE